MDYEYFSENSFNLRQLVTKTSSVSFIHVSARFFRRLLEVDVSELLIKFRFEQVLLFDDSINSSTALSLDSLLFLVERCFFR